MAAIGTVVAAAHLQPCRLPQRAAARPQQGRPQQRRVALLPRAAAQKQQWQPPPGLSILPWTGEPEQVVALQELQYRMAASPYPDVAADEGTLRWFLQDRKLDVDEAEEKLIKMLRWRREFGWVGAGDATVGRAWADGRAGGLC